MDDLESLPDDGLRYELLDGTLVVSPAPTPMHQMVNAHLFVLLASACAPGLTALYAPLDWRPDGITSVQPDLLVVRTADVTPRRLTGTPVLLVEIASPSSQRIDRTLKYDTYAHAGVQQYWIVEPGDTSTPPSIEIHDLVDGSYQLQARAAGRETVTITGPLSVAVTPAELTSLPA